MQNNCPNCGSPITDDARFCSHCGSKLPDNTQRTITEIKFEDTAKLEEVRLKYALEEKISDAKRSGSKSLKIKRWTGWLLCIVCLCLFMIFHETNEPLATVFLILFLASGIYALATTILSVFKRH